MTLRIPNNPKLLQKIQKGFKSLKAPVARVATPNVPLPFNPNLEKHLLPDKEKIERAIRSVLD